MGPCCVEGCEVTSEETYYFEFPTSRLLRRKWLEVIPIPGKLPLGTVVCSRHFSEDDYQNVRGKLRLKSKVVPSLLLERTKNEPPEVNLKPPPDEPEVCDSTTDPPMAPVVDAKADDVKSGKLCGDNGDSGDSLLINTSDSEFTDICETVTVENGRSNCHKIVVKSPIPDPKEDIEDMITNYHIKNKVPNTALMPDMVPVESIPLPDGDPIEIEGANDTAPVIIEISADNDTNENEAESQDCLMILESVQVEVDPSTLLLAQEYDNEDEKAPDKKDDPISLLTSSDEDDVIIQEPHIDTVEVSDTTDEDDMPLVKLVKKKAKKKKVSKKKTRKSKDEDQKEFEKILWGDGMYDYYCMQCNFTTKSSVEYNNHVSEHSKVLQVCPICGFTSASKSVYTRHTRKHKEDKKFKCHLCDYRARHNMSLIYHLKCHDSVKNSVNRGYKCKKCGFRADDRETVMKHVKLCSIGVKIHSCDKCDYQTRRKSDLRRHRMRKHQELEIEFDADFVSEA